MKSLPVIRPWTPTVSLLSMMAAALVAIALYAFDPARTAFAPRCLLHEWTGLHCPGCGTTRALHHLLHGRVTTAFGFNPLALLLLPVLGYSLGRDALAGLAGRPPRGMVLKARWIWTLLAVIVIYGIGRNLPFAPFTAWAPGGGAGG